MSLIGQPKKRNPRNPRNPPTTYEIHIRRTAKTNKQNPLIVTKSTA